MEASFDSRPFFSFLFLSIQGRRPSCRTYFRQRGGVGEMRSIGLIYRTPLLRAAHHFLHWTTTWDHATRETWKRVRTQINTTCRNSRKWFNKRPQERKPPKSSTLVSSFLPFLSWIRWLILFLPFKICTHAKTSGPKMCTRWWPWPQTMRAAWRGAAKTYQKSWSRQESNLKLGQDPFDKANP